MDGSRLNCPLTALSMSASAKFCAFATSVAMLATGPLPLVRFGLPLVGDLATPLPPLPLPLPHPLPMPLPLPPVLPPMDMRLALMVMGWYVVETQLSSVCITPIPAGAHTIGPSHTHTRAQQAASTGTHACTHAHMEHTHT